MVELDQLSARKRAPKVVSLDEAELGCGRLNQIDAGRSADQAHARDDDAGRSIAIDVVHLGRVCARWGRAVVDDQTALDPDVVGVRERDAGAGRMMDLAVSDGDARMTRDRNRGRAGGRSDPEVLDHLAIGADIDRSRARERTRATGAARAAGSGHAAGPAHAARTAGPAPTSPTAHAARARGATRPARTGRSNAAVTAGCS